MWNMSESDKRYYERQEWRESKKNKVLSKAKKRGDAAKEWLKTNKLTPETKPDFDKLMRDVDNGA